MDLNISTVVSIGEGTFSSVFKCLDRKSQKMIAIKRIKRQENQLDLDHEVRLGNLLGLF